MDDNKLFLNRLNDLSLLREKYNNIVFSKFVSINEQLAANRIKNVCMWGGYPESERKVIAFFPDYLTPDDVQWCISPIKIITTDGVLYSHRDYLGSLIGLGIKRDVLGDIIVTPEYTLLFCLDSISEFILQNLKSVSKSNVRCHLEDFNNLVIPEKEFDEITGSVASHRIDSIISVAIGKSRGFSQELLQSGAVQLNYIETTDLSRILRIGDILSVRGFGKFVFDGNVCVSRKGRNIIKLRKYV